MMQGILYGISRGIFGPSAALMEEKPSTAISECKVWKMDVPYYEETGIVRKLEYLREEHIQKLSCHRKGAHFIWNKEGQT